MNLYSVFRSGFLFDLTLRFWILVSELSNRLLGFGESEIESDIQISNRSHPNIKLSVVSGCEIYTHVHFSVGQARATSCTQLLASSFQHGTGACLFLHPIISVFISTWGRATSCAVTRLHFSVRDNRRGRLELN